MRILMLAQFYPPMIGGEERHVRNLAVALSRRGHDVHVATQATSEHPAGEHVEDGVAVHRMTPITANFPSLFSEQGRPHALPVPDPALARALLSLKRRLQPDLAHGHNWIINSWLPAQFRHDHPLVLTLHDYSDRCATKRLMLDGRICTGPGPLKCSRHVIEHYGPAKGALTLGGMWLERPFKHRLVDKVLTVSRAVATGNGLAAAGIDYEVVPNFVPVDLVSQPIGDRSPDLPTGGYLLFVGDITRQKGVHTLIEAHQGLDGERPTLLLIGRTDIDSPTKLPADVQLVNGWPHHLVVNAFQHSLAAVLPSEWPDPCPTTVLEAMALGTPVITTRVGGMVDMVTHERSGLLVEPGDVRDLRQSIQRLIGDPALRFRLVAGAKEAVQPFTDVEVTTTIERVYTDVIEAAS